MKDTVAETDTVFKGATETLSAAPQTLHDKEQDQKRAAQKAGEREDEERREKERLDAARREEETTPDEEAAERSRTFADAAQAEVNARTLVGQGFAPIAVQAMTTTPIGNGRRTQSALARSLQNAGFQTTIRLHNAYEASKPQPKDAHHTEEATASFEALEGPQSKSDSIFETAQNLTSAFMKSCKRSKAYRLTRVGVKKLYRASLRPSS